MSPCKLLNLKLGSNFFYYFTTKKHFLYYHIILSYHIFLKSLNSIIHPSFKETKFNQNLKLLLHDILRYNFTFPTKPKLWPRSCLCFYRNQNYEFIFACVFIRFCLYICQNQNYHFVPIYVSIKSKSLYAFVLIFVSIKTKLWFLFSFCFHLKPKYEFVCLFVFLSKTKTKFLCFFLFPCKAKLWVPLFICVSI